jgi:succinate dehydrogenase/fumarate reductase flavoprotein subunit
MTRTVDVVIVGGGPAAVAAAIDAVGSGLRVLIVGLRNDTRQARVVRQLVESQAPISRGQVIVITGADLVCVDGVNGIEAVVVRRRRTGQLLGFNASALLDFSNGSSRLDGSMFAVRSAGDPTNGQCD